MDKKFKLLIAVLLFTFCTFSCSKSPIRHPIIKTNNTVTRFSMTDGKTGKRYSGIFDEDKDVLLYGEGIIPPFIGGFSYLQKNYSSNIAIDCTGKTYTEFELPEVYESFYGYGIYSTIEDNSDYWVLHNIKTKESLRLNTNYSFVDNINTFSTNSEFDYLVYFDTSNEKYGFINSTGKIILNAICEKIEPFPDNGYWQVLINDKWMLFKEDEGILDPEKYLDFGKVK